ncbi:MAG TPA: hypothetical protein VG244_00900 [Acidimicrobiales bacterium]|jgi:hypothetical protein|nr:hypothetical protein [Acidimicrobiales bacterium]
MPRRHGSRHLPTRARARTDAENPEPRRGSHWQADGTAKTSYMSRGEAHSVAHERLADVGVELDAYRCATCSAWHLGKPAERDD